MMLSIYARSRARAGGNVGGAIIAPTSPEIWGMSAQVNAKARGSKGEMARIAGRITSCATLAVLLAAYASPDSAQGTKMSYVADQ